MDYIIESIRKDYQEGNLIPVIGAGCSKPFDIPDWDELLQEIANRAVLDESYKKVIFEEIKAERFFNALKLLLDKTQMNEEQLQKKVSDIINEIKKPRIKNLSTIDNNYLDILEMQFKTILTFNYDEIIYDIAAPSGCYGKPINIKDFNRPQEIGNTNHILYLHGFISSPKTIVLSEKSYNQLYKGKKYPYIDLLKGIATSKKFLFVGTSLTDIYINAFMSKLNKDWSVDHYAIMDNASYSENKKEIERLKIKVLPFDEKKGFTSEIRNILSKIQGKEIITSHKPVEYDKISTTICKKDKNSFIDRKEELQMCFDLINDKLDNKAICFYGFGGRGLTELLKRFFTDANSMPNNPIKILRSAALGEGVQSLAGYLRSILGEISNSKEDTMFYNSFITIQNNLCILIDGFPHNNEKFVNDFISLLKEVDRNNKNIYFIITCRDNPFWGLFNSFVKSHQLNGLSKDDFSEYIDKNKDDKDPEFYKWILNNIDRVHKISKGYPRIINIILSNPSTKSSIEKGSIEDFFLSDETMDSVMKEIYDSIISDYEMINALELLTILSIYEPEWKDIIPREILGNRWGRIKSRLQSMALLTPTSEGYKLDEYISIKILLELTQKRKAECHKQIAETYFDPTIEHPQKYNLALNHLIKYTKITQENLLLKEKFDLCYSELENMCDYSSLKVSLSKVIELKSLLNDMNNLSFKKNIYYKYVKILTASGSTSEALNIIEKFEYDPEMIRKLLPLKADCFRLKGRVEDYKELYENALKDCTEEVEKTSLNIGYGHALYLCGEFSESKKEYDKINTKSLDDSLKQANFEYRRSKTFRMLGDFDNAMTCADKAIRICDSLFNNENHEKTVIKARSHWAKCACYRLKNEFDKAFCECNKAKKLLIPTPQKEKFDEIDVPIDVVGHRVEWFLEQEIAEIRRGQGNYSEAIHIFEIMQTQTNKLDEKNREALSYLGLAESIRTQDQMKDKNSTCHKAISYYNKAKVLFQEMNIKWGLLVCDIGMAFANQDFKDETWQKFSDICKEHNFLYEEEIVIDVMKIKEPKFYQINFI